MNRLQSAYSSYGQQISIKDDQIRALQEQVNAWWMNYEALAKLYSQLRLEHPDLLKQEMMQVEGSPSASQRPDTSLAFMDHPYMPK